MKSKQIIPAFSILLIILLIIIAIQYSGLSRKYEKQTDRLFNEIEEYHRKYTLLEENLRSLNSNSNEVRRILSLPESNLSIFDSEKMIEISDNGADNLAFYNAVDYMLIHADKIEMEIELNNFLNSDVVEGYLLKKKLQIIKIGPSSYKLLISNNPYFTVTTDNPKNPTIFITSILSKKESFLLKEIIDNNSLLFTHIDLEIPLIDQHYDNYNQLKKKFVHLAVDRSLNNYFNSENLEISDLKSDKNGYYYFISNKDLTFSIKVALESLSLQFSIAGRKFDRYTDFYAAIREVLENSDKRTEEIRLVELSKLKVESVLSDEAFYSYLKKNDFEVNLTPREDNDYFYYDIKAGIGDLVGSFAVQKIIGDIYLMDSEDIMISSLKFLESSVKTQEVPVIDIPENLPLIIDKYSNKSSTTFVVIGSHENNADTIIIVHADENTGKMTLVAVPRDLYYQERKINDYYRTYGGNKFTEILSDITGLSIKGYVAVDMYAFIDLINILGGIDINLESDLIDPTYMVRNNGEWSTLYYKKGNHHLNGIESLRIARSRHTSSDFGRTSRQQLVIQGIKDKMSGLDITDLGTILKLFQTLENYLDTNFSAMEMLSLFMKYKDTEVNRKQGLSTFNVLYNTYTNINKLEDKSRQFEDDFYRGYWILLPRKDDWNVIKWYIRSLIEDDEI